MFVVMNRIEVDPERTSVFEEHFGGSMTRTLGGVPGLIRSTLLRPAKADQPYLSTMEFETRDDFVAWMASDSFRASHGETNGAELGVGANSVDSYELITEVRR